GSTNTIFSIPTGRITPKSTDRETALEVTPNRNFHTSPDLAYGIRKTITGLTKPQRNGITARNIVLNRSPVPARTLRSPSRISPTLTTRYGQLFFGLSPSAFSFGLSL